MKYIPVFRGFCASQWECLMLICSLLPSRSHPGDHCFTQGGVQTGGLWRCDRWERIGKWGFFQQPTTSSLPIALVMGNVRQSQHYSLQPLGKDYQLSISFLQTNKLLSVHLICCSSFQFPWPWGEPECDVGTHTHITKPSSSPTITLTSQNHSFVPPAENQYFFFFRGENSSQSTWVQKYSL